MEIYEERTKGTSGRLRLSGKGNVHLILRGKIPIPLPGMSFHADLYVGNGTDIACTVKRVNGYYLLVLNKCAMLSGQKLEHITPIEQVLIRLWILEVASSIEDEYQYKLALPNMSIGAPAPQCKLAELWVTPDEGPDCYLLSNPKTKKEIGYALVQSLQLSSELREKFAKRKCNRLLYHCKFHTKFSKWVPTNEVKAEGRKKKPRLKKTNKEKYSVSV